VKAGHRGPLGCLWRCLLACVCAGGRRDGVLGRLLGRLAPRRGAEGTAA
jgi:hypothetical protein